MKYKLKKPLNKEDLINSVWIVNNDNEFKFLRIFGEKKGYIPFIVDSGTVCFKQRRKEMKFEDYFEEVNEPRVLEDVEFTGFSLNKDNSITPACKINKIEESSSEFLQRLGIDGQKWAKEFIKMFGNKKEEIDEELMVAWFCNSIMAGYDNSDKKYLFGCDFGLDYHFPTIKGSFGWAVEQMKQGKKVRRKHWKNLNGFALFIYPQIGLLFTNNRTSDKLTIEDIEANDWEIFKEESAIEKKIRLATNTIRSLDMNDGFFVVDEAIKRARELQ